MVSDAGRGRRPTDMRKSRPAYLAYSTSKHTYLPVKNLNSTRIALTTSIGVWFRTGRATTRQTLLDCGAALMVGIQQNGRIVMNATIGASTSDRSVGRYDDNRWVFVAGVSTPLGTTVYINGRVVDVDVILNLPLGPAPVVQCVVGGSAVSQYGTPSSFANSFGGRISMMKIWDGALSARDIMDLHLAECSTYSTC